MAQKLSNAVRDKHMQVRTDAIGDYVLYPNGQKMYFFTTAITANSTVTTATAGDKAQTTHATGRASIFVSDGSKWQFLTNA